MIAKLSIGAGAVLLLLAIVVATRPSGFHFERSITIAAPAESVFAQVNDFRAWPAWSPYEKLDPHVRKTYSGASTGTGAVYAWSGNSAAGEGRATIVSSDIPSQIKIRLELVRPCAATNAVTFTFDSVPGGTEVTWAMDGRCNFMGKAASLFIDMDKMVGTEFERGLAALKATSEATRSARTVAATAAN